mmetsp:Transcript_25693/g.48726  ORF Transcript_25693/g.48726 Transcript_25693/m.48726 type:complete len:244 (-) Transcript_25693:507-1238(-)
MDSLTNAWKGLAAISPSYTSASASGLSPPKGNSARATHCSPCNTPSAPHVFASWLAAESSSPRCISQASTMPFSPRTMLVAAACSSAHASLVDTNDTTNIGSAFRWALKVSSVHTATFFSGFSSAAGECSALASGAGAAWVSKNATKPSADILSGKGMGAPSRGSRVSAGKSVTPYCAHNASSLDLASASWSRSLYLRESALYSGVVTSLFVKRMALGRDPDAPTNSAALPSAEATAVTNEGI